MIGKGTARRLLLLAAFCVLVVVARVAGDASRSLRQGRIADAGGEHHLAAVHYGRALHSYLPLSPVGDRASARLLALADRALAEGDRLEARFALEELRSGWLAVRSTWQPGADWIAEAEARLLPLMLDDPRAAWPDPALPASERTRIAEAALAAREDPALGWVLVMGFGWLLWVGAAAGAIWKGLPDDDEGAIAWPVVGRWAAGSALGYGLWLLGVWLA